MGTTVQNLKKKNEINKKLTVFFFISYLCFISVLKGLSLYYLQVHIGHVI